MIKSTSTTLILKILLCGSMSGLVAAENHSLVAITNAAIDFASKHVEHHDSDIRITARELDSRLTLKQCNTHLEAFSNQTGRFIGNTVVGIRCNDTKPWMIYVPVSIKVFQTVAVASRPLAHNSIIRDEDLKLMKLDVTRLSGGIISDTADLVGYQLTRPVRMDQPLSSNMVKRPIIVRRGDRVTLLAGTNIVEVRVEGEALMDGSLGDRIKVKNLRSRRTIEGKVSDHGNTVIVN